VLVWKGTSVTFTEELAIGPYSEAVQSGLK